MDKETKLWHDVFVLKGTVAELDEKLKKIERQVKKLIQIYALTKSFNKIKEDE